MIFVCLSHSVFLTTSFLKQFYHNVFLITSFTLRLPQNDLLTIFFFLTTSSHNVFLKTPVLPRLFHNVFLTAYLPSTIPSIRLRYRESYLIMCPKNDSFFIRTVSNNDLLVPTNCNTSSIVTSCPAYSQLSALSKLQRPLGTAAIFC